MPAPYTDYRGAFYLVRTSGTDLHFTPPVPGVHIFWFQGTPEGCRAREWGPITQWGSEV
jgi:hypothetical protein